MKRLIQTMVLLLGFSSILDGCFWETKVNEEFGHVKKLSELNGTYRNLGKVAPSSIRTFYLSFIIWPDDEKLDHKSIDTVEVHTIDDNTLALKAYQEGVLVKEDEFVAGKDFEYSEGRIKLGPIGELTGNEPGAVVLGGSIESIELGIDRAGHGKGRESVFAAGLFGLVIPIVAGTAEEVSFEKISNFYGSQ